MKITDTLLNKAHQDVVFGDKGQKELLKGAEILYRAVKSTMGPSGRNVIIDNGISPPFITKDGVTVAKNINLKNHLQNIGAGLVKEVALKTNELGGDGPQPLYSKILTPTGWKTMGDIKIGDTICGTNNTFQKVLGVYPKGKKEIYKIEFSGGQFVECCEDHLWSIVTNTGKKKTITTKELFQSGVVFYKKNTRCHKFYVPNTSVEFAEKTKLKIDPYTLGVLLGDGSLSMGKTSVEISVGLNEEYILNNLILPKNNKINKSFYMKKHYIKGKIGKINKYHNGKDIKDFLRELNLLGTYSHTKFIPDSYLFSSKKSREALLNGLIDTDGYINNKNLFEISTVSEQLKNDIVFLCRSLGKQVCVTEYARKPGSAFGTRKIYRITELKGRKYGIQIKSIKPTGSFTEMQCIKVSNSDSLYITDNFIPTHNTTTATVLAYHLFNSGYKFSAAGRNAILLKKGIDWATDVVIKRLKEISTEVRNDEDIISVGTISANGDREIGKLLCEAIKKVGEDGIITVEKAKSVKTTLSVIDGLNLDVGYISPFFVTNQEKLTSDLENPLVLVTNKKISTKEQLIPVMKIANEKSRSLLIIADEIDQEPLHMLLTNKMHGAVISCAVKAPSYGDNRIDILHDICLITGATCFDAAQSIQLEKLKEEHLGSCEKIVVSKMSTTFFGLGESVKKEQIDERVKELKQVLSMPVEGLDDLKRNNVKKRLAKLAGGIAIIHVGGSTEVEIIEKKDRVDDALNATQAAVQEGILPGGGTALFYCSEFLNEKISKNEEGLSEDEIFGAKIVYETCKAPLKVIVDNTGKNPEVVMDHILRTTNSLNYGYNAFTHTYENLIDNGVSDPVKVTRYALEFASSVVGLMLTCNCVIMTPEEERNEIEE